ncbi:MAG TPA: membrane protein insertase YidC [Candidatus Paceibacterota bacterium]|nr:membrane protein insertase YidC [Candidatus Paceibacterota bacterium]
MDRKSIIALVICFLVLMLWYPLVNKLYPPKPLPPGATNAPVATVTTTNWAAPPAVTAPVLEQPAPAPQPLVTADVPEELLTVANDNARYTFSSHGGGLKLVELLERESPRRKQAPQTNVLATLNSVTRPPTLALLGGEAVQGDGIFRLNRIDGGVRAEKSLTNGLSIVKEFRLSTNYLVAATVRLENRSSQPLTLPAQQWIIGTATPMGPDDNGMVIGVMWYNGAKTDEAGASFFSSTGFACMPRTPPAEYRAGADNVVWAAAHNQFFTLALMPEQPAKAVVAHKIILPRPTGADATPASASKPPPEGYEGALIYPGQILAPGQAFTNQVSLFAGPKEYQTLARLGSRFNNNIDLVMGYGGFFGFFAKALLLAMNWLHHALGLSYGWAIIAITFIIKLVFWPLTQASTRSMKRLQALQPQMKAIKDKYKDDPAKMNKKTMEFMKEHKVSPLGGCLPMLLQIPIFFGFYKMIQSAFELRGEHFLWVKDLSKPDTLFTIPGTGFPFNLLPLIMGATMLWQARLTPPSPGMDAMQAKMMRYMPLMFLVFLYNFSAGLTLYWTVQNLLTIAQTMLTRTTPEPAVPVKAPVLTAPQKKRK